MPEKTLRQGWARVSFGDVVHLNTERVTDPGTAGVERYVGLEHITPNDLRIRNWGLVAEGTTFTNRFKPGQVLFGKRRAYQRKVAVADFEGVCSSDIYVFETKNASTLLPELLPFICQTEGFYEYAVGTSAGSLSPRTNWNHLSKYEFALPPLEEQLRITKVLKATDFLIDTKLYLQSSLESLINSYRESVYFSINSPKTKIKDICDIRYGLGQPPRISGSGIPMIRATNINKGEITENDLLLVDPADLPQKRTIYLVEGDIILVRSGAYTGDSAMITGKWQNSVAGYDLVLSPDNNKVHPRFLSEFILHIRTVRTILIPMSARTAQPHLNAAQVGSVEVVLPNLDIQHRIVQIFDGLNNTISNIRKNIELLKSVKKSLVNKLLY